MLITYFVIGVLLVWAFGIAKPTRWLYARIFDGCDFCVGVWVFSLLAWPFYVPSTMLMGIPYMPVASEFVCGVAASFAVHIFRIGWAVRFNNDN